MKDKLIPIINELEEIIKEKNLHISDQELLDFSLRIYITESINDSKNNNSNFPKKTFLNNQNQTNQNQNKPFTKYHEEPATQKQKDEIKRLGGTVPAGLTKKDASKKISQLQKGEE